MSFSNANQQKDSHKAMSVDQFNQVVEAISQGRYSWACVLILRFAGYNPVHFIPYRTYSRLLKDNSQLSAASSRRHGTPTTDQRPIRSSDSKVPSKRFNTLHDLSYLEETDRSETKLRGGWVGSETEIEAVDFQSIFTKIYCINSRIKTN
jgi:hypothetical protein